MYNATSTLSLFTHTTSFRTSVYQSDFTETNKRENGVGDERVQEETGDNHEEIDVVRVKLL
jgi:hypothetical protein